MAGTEDSIVLPSQAKDLDGDWAGAWPGAEVKCTVSGGAALLVWRGRGTRAVLRFDAASQRLSMLGAAGEVSHSARVSGSGPGTDLTLVWDDGEVWASHGARTWARTRSWHDCTTTLYVCVRGHRKGPCSLNDVRHGEA